MFLLNSVRRLQKLSDLYRRGALLQEFRLRGKPRSVTCVHKTLTPWMKHTRVPRTVRRDILRLAIETSSIPSLHIFEAESEIRSKVESKTVNKPNGPNRTSNRLKQEKMSHTLCHAEILLGLIDVVQCLHYLRREPSILSKSTLPAVEFNLSFAIADQAQTKRICLAQTLYQHRSALPYMGCCTPSSCSSTKGSRILGLAIQQTKA